MPFNFYEMRYLYGDDDDEKNNGDSSRDSSSKKSMQTLWRAAQQSRNRAFVSCDAAEAGRWTASTGVTGPLPGSYFYGDGGI